MTTATTPTYRRIPDEYFMIIDKEPGDRQWTERPWRNLTAGDVPLGSIITNPKRPDEAVAQLRFNPARDVQSVKYKQFAAAGHGTGSGDLLQEMPGKRHEGFNRTTLQFVTGSTTFSRLQSYTADQLMWQQAVRAEMAAGKHLFIVTGAMVAEGECTFTTSLDGNDRSETHTRDRVDKQGFGPRLLGLTLVEVWEKSRKSGEACIKQYRPTSGYAYAYEEERVEGVYTVLQE
ncbi:hypothetical protein MCOR25_004824 [Pyricularia grisea]|uniref:Uncharacterized protein n=1 Tax=Pyricularia grisea TaxID=148305 RepID=A0A6P8B2W5_PYRGI|nr:uncharacterized protein PgNI_07341 [Pyricularia grisea]KAI6367747.1 hypothetical protein MCOR25_004824 [Pyricularia grisea]TLD09192.1 hypothetical protein PgNI_07341 [Pyricularia grisea]